MDSIQLTNGKEHDWYPCPICGAMYRSPKVERQCHGGHDNDARDADREILRILHRKREPMQPCDIIDASSYSTTHIYNRLRKLDQRGLVSSLSIITDPIHTVYTLDKPYIED